jgi:hypothetical protein
MIDCAIARTPRCLLFCLGLAICAAAPAADQQKKPGNDAVSVTGDWEYVLNGPLKLQLHLKVGADGALAGSIDTPDSPPQHIELSNVQLSGKVLKYTWPQRGAFTEVIQSDGNSMVGAMIWQRVASALSVRDVAGDWESHSTGASVKATQILHLRSGSNGSLTGYLDETPNGPRLTLQEVRILGTTIMFTLPDGKVLKGAFNSDRHTIAGSQGDPTWQRARTIEQALAADAVEKEKNKLPTDGTWTGVIEHIAWSEFVKTPPKGAFRYVAHLASAPSSCSVQLEIPGDDGQPDTNRPCEMKQEGATVTISGRVAGTFSGALHGNQIVGTWIAANRRYFTPFTDSPMKVTLTREAATSATH